MKTEWVFKVTSLDGEIVKEKKVVASSLYQAERVIDKDFSPKWFRRELVGGNTVWDF